MSYSQLITQSKTKFDNLSDYWTYINMSYSEEEQLIIESFISYYSNQMRGFDNQNDQELYQENIKLDTNGSLQLIALVGFEMEKEKYINKQNKIQSKL